MAVAQVILAVTVVVLQSAEQAETMQQKQLIRHRVVHIQYVQEAAGHAASRTPVVQEWDVVHT